MSTVTYMLSLYVYVYMETKFALFLFPLICGGSG